MAFAIGAAAAATPASAQATRTWVSGVGDDVNPCSRTAPCKTFAGAISKTAPGGEINCLDPAGFGAVTLTKSITIDCTGTLGGVLASSTTGVIVNGAGAIVTLRGLEINGGPPNLPGVNGVRFLQGARVNIEDCTIYNFLGAAPNGFGVIVNNTSTAVTLHIRNTVIRNNGTAVSGGGIGLLPTGTGTVRASLENVTITGHFNGIQANSAGTSGVAGVNISIHNSAIDDNINGITLNSAAIQATGMLIDSSVVNNTGTGLTVTGASSRIRVGNTTVTNNGTGVSITLPSAINTYGNNRLIANGVDGAFTAPAIGEQ
ncbi:MAG TPA: hypothetical protein VGO55_11305 [Allosphingosinicella sp.]|nr:hypothetical protein [Allosphingosinicella sp.]